MEPAWAGADITAAPPMIAVADKSPVMKVFVVVVMGFPFVYSARRFTGGPFGLLIPQTERM
jgi:hypothetical protein